MNIRWNRLNRKVHYWGAIICALPVLIILVAGILLLLKKEISWIQPPTMRGEGSVPALTYAQILDVSRSIPQAKIENWSDIDRIDLRPSKGLFKIQSRNNWEIQVDHRTGEVLSAAFRRSGIIESIHDGSFFHDKVKFWVFLPAASTLLLLWMTGIYLFLLPMLAKRRARKKRQPEPETLGVIASQQ